MDQEKALEKVNWSGVFPWVTKEMEIFPQQSVLIYASFHGIIYNSNSIPKNKAPKSYEDLIDPALAPDLGGKDGDPFIHSLADSRVADLGKGKGFAFRAQARDSGRRAIAPGRRRAHRQRRVPDHGEHRRRAGGDVEMASQRGAARGAARLDAGDELLLSIVGAEKFGSSEYGQTIRRASW